ncbi:hypothetical protein K488DRAFT_91612 [Vararia minispora EC-137]|uniref:Uncharacterized protein n=1 Tax=Vararia minispora EC-137 TaxID=1314806 RepID=A0ACB8Q5R0_9AGAM|nr:hypothetical protein K488DRAFT_91612 [Vararia minispora EC-137]
MDGGRKEVALLRSSSLKAGATALLDDTQANNIGAYTRVLPSFCKDGLVFTYYQVLRARHQVIGWQQPTTEVVHLSNFGGVCQLANTNQYFFEARRVQKEMKHVCSDCTTPSGDQFTQVIGPSVVLSTEMAKAKLVAVPTCACFTVLHIPRCVA